MRIKKILFYKIKTAYHLGFKNIIMFFLYKLQIKFNKRKVSTFVFDDNIDKNYFHIFRPLNENKNDTQKINWFFNKYTNLNSFNSNVPWYELSDFGCSSGDIKGIWLASRFDWSLCLTRDYLFGEKEALDEINSTILDWVEHNPPYKGPNWKCGQEASFRVLNLAFTAKLLSQVDNPKPCLLELIKMHLHRIAPTISYAIAQDNNHGTSEAAALFIGGSWLVKCGDQSAIHWKMMGQKWLENRAKHLIENDGSFSQYSINYHRLMVDTYVMAELWRRELKLPLFHDVLYERLRASTNWLYQMVQFETGDVPNIGANDGAHLLQLTNSDYRDFRPSVQLAAVVFYQSSAWLEDGVYDEPLQLLKLSKPTENFLKSSSFHFEHGGYIGLKSLSGAFVLFNYPQFRFRPSQCDALHVDFWFNGVNLLRDGGTFSYNAGSEYIDYYSGTQSHNTIQFDDHDQMPRLSRFLLGSWLRAKNVDFDEHKLIGQASYRDYLGCDHHRKVSLMETCLIVNDELRGIKNKAVLRWRLNPDKWCVQGNIVTNGYYEIKIDSDVKINRLEIIEGKESRYYYQETFIPVLEIEVSSDCTITTEYKFHS